MRGLCQVLLMLCVYVGGVTAQEAGSWPKAQNVPGIENVWMLGPGLVSGGEPGGEAGLAELKRRGIRTVVSVDGAVPPVETARRLGLRYVHVPVGYDGISEENSLKLAKAMAMMPGPIYVHCHHGKHRGPAAAAVMARAGMGWSAEQALGFMQKAGTSAEYQGLYESVGKFQPPGKLKLEKMDVPLPEAVDVPELVDLMVEMDERMDWLKSWLVRMDVKELKEKNRVGVAREVKAARENGVQLRELVRESARLPECREKPVLFQKGLTELESDLTRWLSEMDGVKEGEEVEAERWGRLEKRIGEANQQCLKCHKAFRNKK